MNKTTIFIVILSFFCSCQQEASSLKKIDLEDFFKEPSRSNFKLSPCGKYYSVFNTNKNKRTLLVLGTNGKDTIYSTSPTNEMIDFYTWIEEDNILLKSTTNQNISILTKVNIISGQNEILLQDDSLSINSINALNKNLAELIFTGHFKGKQQNELLRFNYKKRQLGKIHSCKGKVSSRIFDNYNKYRIAVVNNKLTDSVMYRVSEKDNFKPLFTFDHVHDFFKPLFFSTNNKTFYAYSNLGRDKIALVEYNPQRNTEEKVIYELDDFDVLSNEEIDMVKYSRNKNRLSYILHTTDRKRYHFFDDSYKKLTNYFSENFPNKVYQILASNADETKHLIKLSCDKSTGTVNFYDCNTNRLVELENLYPWLNEKNLSPKNHFAYRSSDGYKIHAYLTIPKGKKAENLPLIVFPHGGPAWRDSWELGRLNEIQLLASRGYAVLQINFRGSFGFGKKFLTAGFKQNGLKVQDDITEGVNHLINRGIVDKDKIAILGGSYGGYLVLAGLTFTPDLYSCGVDLFGVSDLVTFLSKLPPWFNKEALHETIGHPIYDIDLLKKSSPINSIDSIKAPVLIAHGGLDPIVDKQESIQIVNALKNKGIKVEFIYEDNEGHGYFEDESARLRLWKSIEKFLEENINKHR